LLQTAIAKEKLAASLSNSPTSNDEKERYKFLKVMKTKELEMMMQSMIPIIKIQASQYLIGCDLKWLEIKGINIMVRVGGGF